MTDKKHDQNAHLDDAHGHCYANGVEIARSSECGCFYCLELYPPTLISDWADAENNGTAICPKCGVDSVLGSASSYPLTRDFLTDMRRRFFDNER